MTAFGVSLFKNRIQESYFVIYVEFILVTFVFFPSSFSLCYQPDRLPKEAHERLDLEGTLLLIRTNRTIDRIGDRRSSSLNSV